MNRLNLYHICLIALLSLITMLTACDHKKKYEFPHKLILKTGWKFKCGDNLAYRIPEFNDNNWRTINVPKEWEKQGYPDYYGYAWYRIRTVIPLSLKNENCEDTLKFFLGIINDNDQVYLNGFPLGQNAEALSADAKTDTTFINKGLPFLCFRIYKISASDKRIRWNKENVIAVRVYNTSENGGILASVPYIGMKGLDEEVYFDHSRCYTLNFFTQSMIDTTVILRNAYKNRSICGDVSIRAENVNSKAEMFKYEQSKVTIPAQKALTVPVSLAYTTDSVRIFLAYKDDAIGMTIKDTIDLPFVLQKVKKTSAIK